MLNGSQVVLSFEFNRLLIIAGGFQTGIKDLLSLERHLSPEWVSLFRYYQVGESADHVWFLGVLHSGAVLLNCHSSSVFFSIAITADVADNIIADEETHFGSKKRIYKVLKLYESFGAANIDHLLQGGQE